MKTYFIGIDIAKFKHDCFIMDDNGEVIKDSFTITNDKTGFLTLHSALKSLDPKFEKRIGLEATGHYGMNLKIYLERSGYSFMEFNPILIDRFKKATTLRRTKTDKIDARLIASYLSSIKYEPYPLSSYHLSCLTALTRDRVNLVDERSRHLVKMTNILDKIFPEFKKYFSNGFKSRSALYLLENYGYPSKMANMTRSSYDKMCKELKKPISYASFCKIKEEAKDTIGNEDEILIFQLRYHLELFKELDQVIDKIDEVIIEEYKCFNSHISSIPGIGIISAASIFSEIGDIKRFKDINKLIAFCGLEPSTYQSGESEYTGHMVKHGSSYLRRHIMNCAITTLIHIPPFYDYYHKKRSEGKVHRVALSHLAKRLLKIIYTLEKNDLDFDMDKVR